MSLQDYEARRDEAARLLNLAQILVNRARAENARAGRVDLGEYELNMRLAEQALAGANANAVLANAAATAAQIPPAV